ncbi:hypothetical protein ABW19_dt0208687 [Dactylella cylindrospora]|nr:hypothetical protein ABW19_dt0208687 [Dactylella cylindrospora]
MHNPGYRWAIGENDFGPEAGDITWSNHRSLSGEAKEPYYLEGPPSLGSLHSVTDDWMLNPSFDFNIGRLHGSTGGSKYWKRDLSSSLPGPKKLHQPVRKRDRTNRSTSPPLSDPLSMQTPILKPSFMEWVSNVACAPWDHLEDFPGSLAKIASINVNNERQYANFAWIRHETLSFIMEVPFGALETPGPF